MTHIRTHTRFLAGENAPSAVDLNAGVLVPNHLGNIILKLNAVDVRLVMLDRTVNPPVLHLHEAPVALLFGETTSDGKFVRYDNELSSRPSTVTGVYNGPGSELKIY